MSQNDILFVHVEPGDEKLDPGDWFFHTGGWWLCGQTGQEEDGRWYLVGVPTRANRSPHDESIKFASLADVKEYIATYYERPVREVRPDEMPDPSDL
jgi:hypothetical protein